METVISLQELINNKAEVRLNKDLEEISQIIRQSRLLSITNSDAIPGLTYAGKEEYPFWVFKTNGKYMQAVKSYWLPIYQSEETKDFIEKVEGINRSVEELMNNQSYD